MEYRVEQLAARAGLRIDTVRYYQSRGLLPPPRRSGRIALYGEAHLARLQRIRDLRDEGLSLALIQRVLEREDAPADEPLLQALVHERVGARTFSRAELAARAGIPEALVAAAQSAGLVEALRVEGEERFGEADLAMAEAALEVLQGGFPLQDLLALAVDHAGSVERVVDRAIDLFDAHVRRADAGDAGRSERVGRAFRTLLPQVTRLVALHFQRTLVSRALARLEQRGERGDLRDALAATERSELEVSVGWR